MVALYLFVDSAPLGLSLLDLLINFSYSLLLARAVSLVSLKNELNIVERNFPRTNELNKEEKLMGR